MIAIDASILIFSILSVIMDDMKVFIIHKYNSLDFDSIILYFLTDIMIGLVINITTKALENTKWLASFLYYIHKYDDCYFVFCSLFDVMFIIKQIVVSKYNKMVLKCRLLHLCIINSCMWMLTTEYIFNMVITDYRKHICISTYSGDARSNDKTFLSHCYRYYSLYFDI